MTSLRSFLFRDDFSNCFFFSGYLLFLYSICTYLFLYFFDFYLNFYFTFLFGLQFPFSYLFVFYLSSSCYFFSIWTLEAVLSWIKRTKKRNEHFSWIWTYPKLDEDKFVNFEGTRELEMTDPGCLRLFNIILNKSFRSMNLFPVKGPSKEKSYFNPNAKHSLVKHKLEVWPGYITRWKLIFNSWFSEITFLQCFSVEFT